MLHEEICTYEVCKLAKEKGFNVPTDRYYHIYDDVIEAQNSLEMTGDGCADFYNSLNRCRCAAPTHSLLQRWLREEKALHIQITLWQKGWYCDIWAFEYYDEEKRYSAKMLHQSPDYSTYELAIEDALKYALENLV